MRLATAILSVSVCFLAGHIIEASGQKSLDVLKREDSRIEHLTPSFFPEYDSERVKVSYGTLTVPAMNDHGGMQKSKSLVALPCEDCVITWMQANLEYPDGTTADAANGMWLHHTVFSNQNRRNAVCSSKRGGDKFFASGNERTPIDLSASGQRKSGYYIAPGDKMGMVVDLMNMEMEPRDVVLSVTWEYIPSVPDDFDKLTLYWLDIGGCGSSDKPGQSHASFYYSSPTKKSPIQGRVVAITGHLHDGGTHVEVTKNDEVVCRSEATYRGRHISNISDCQDVGTTSPHDRWYITAYYDTAKHQPMATHEGHLEPVMGIALAYVIEDEMVSPPHKHHHWHRWLKVLGGLLAVNLVCLAIAFWMKRRSMSLSDLVPQRVRDWIPYKRLNANAAYGTLPLLGDEYPEEARYHDEEE